MSSPIRILVLCTANRCRSQMAQGWLQHCGGDAVEVHSAGTRPRSVHPLAVQVMAEASIDISHHRGDHVDQYVSEDFDWVITVCDAARESCPVFPGARQTMHHAFQDPDAAEGDEAQRLEVFREVRDAVGVWAKDFLKTSLQND